MRSSVFSGLLFKIIAVFTNYSFVKLHPNNSIQIQNSVLTLSKLNLQNGDLTFRGGMSIESQIVLLTEQRSGYSHIGLIYNFNSKTFVIHSVPAESDKDFEYIRMENIEEFISEDKVERFAVYRLNDSLQNEVQSASFFAYNCNKKKYSFDNDLTSDMKLYRTELIREAYKHAGIYLVRNRLRNINFIITSKILIIPNSIVESELLQNVYSN